MPFAIASFRRVRNRGPATLVIGESTIHHLPKSAHTVWLLSGSDVSLFTHPLPKLSSKKLQQVLPHVIEEYLLSEVGAYSATFAANREGEHWIAAIGNSAHWQEFSQFLALRGGRQEALPQTLCLPINSAFFMPRPDGLINVSARRDAADGVGVTVTPENLATTLSVIFSAPTRPFETPFNTAIETSIESDAGSDEPLKRSDAPPHKAQHTPIASWTALGFTNEVPTYLPPAESYQRYDWGHWINVADKCPLNLLRFYKAGLSNDGKKSATGQSIQSISWAQMPQLRGLLIAAMAAVGFSVLGINLDAWRLAQQAQDLQVAQQQVFTRAYPNEIISSNPLDALTRLQSRQTTTAKPTLAPVFTLLQKFEAAIQTFNSDGKKIKHLEYAYDLQTRSYSLIVQWNVLSSKDMESATKLLTNSGFKILRPQIKGKQNQFTWTIHE